MVDCIEDMKPRKHCFDGQIFKELSKDPQILSRNGQILNELTFLAPAVCCPISDHVTILLRILENSRFQIFE